MPDTFLNAAAVFQAWSNPHIHKGWAEADIAEFMGRTFTAVTRDDNLLYFQRADGGGFLMCHEQSCCETVELEDVAGDLTDLVGAPIVMAEEESNGDLDGGSDNASRTWMRRPDAGPSRWWSRGVGPTQSVRSPPRCPGHW